MIYNIGGYWYHHGNNNIQVKSASSYDFWKVPYHNINFEDLHEVKK